MKNEESLNEEITKGFVHLSEMAKDLFVPKEIQRIEKPSSTAFLRDYVNNNLPVIITGFSFLKQIII